MTAIALPGRRPQATYGWDWAGAAYQVSLGFCPETGALAELFVKGAKQGSDLDALCDDLGVLVSKLLQAGVPVLEMRANLGRVPGPGDPPGLASQPASLLGGLLAFVAAREAEARAFVRGEMNGGAAT